MSIHKRITTVILASGASDVQDKYTLDQLERIAQDSSHAFWIATGHTLTDIGQTAPSEEIQQQ